MLDHDGAKRPGQFGGSIGAEGIDNEDFVGQQADTVEGIAQGLFRIKSKKNGGGPHTFIVADGERRKVQIAQRAGIAPSPSVC